MSLRPVLTPAEIEAQVMERVPKMPGERKCAFEKRKCMELREHIRRDLERQNIANEAYNRQLTTGAVQQ